MEDPRLRRRPYWQPSFYPGDKRTDRDAVRIRRYADAARTEARSLKRAHGLERAIGLVDERIKTVGPDAEYWFVVYQWLREQKKYRNRRWL